MSKYHRRVKALVNVMVRAGYVMASYDEKAEKEVLEMGMIHTDTEALAAAVEEHGTEYEKWVLSGPYPPMKNQRRGSP